MNEFITLSYRSYFLNTRKIVMRTEKTEEEKREGNIVA